MSRQRRTLDDMAHAADGPRSEPAVDDMFARHTEPICRVSGLASLVMHRPDLDRARRFLTDFGLVLAAEADDRLDLRGDGPDPVLYTVHRGPPRFGGLVLTVDDAGLERLAAQRDVSIEPHDAPGGGRRVRLRDPNGWPIDVVAGRRLRPVEPPPPPLPSPRTNAPLRRPVAPPTIQHLGHVALEVVDFEVTVRWYIEHFGLIASDVQHLADGTPALAFLRCDRGAEPTDHHTIVVSRSYRRSVNHAAFEVDDVDAVAMGQRVLREAGWHHAWGIGRHLMGSQIFDYWRDPWGSAHEHYADGDHLDATHPTGRAAFNRGNQSQWGPLMPRSFVDRPVTPGRLWTLVRNLWRSPELTVARLIALWRALR